MKKVLAMALALAMIAGTITLTSCDEADLIFPTNSGDSSGNTGIPADPTTSELPISDSTEEFPFDEHAEGAEAVAKMVGNSINLMPDYFDKLLPYTRAGGYEWVDAEEDYNLEWADKLLDGDITTKWCMGKSETELNSVVVWSMTQLVAVTHYSLTTANDNETYPNRNPVAWRLYGTNLEIDESMMMDYEFLGTVDDDMIPTGWELVDQVWDSDLPDANFIECGFSVDKPAAYQYYILLIDWCDTDGFVFQLSELTLYGYPGNVCPPNTDVPSTASVNEFEEGAEAVEQMDGNSTT